MPVSKTVVGTLEYLAEVERISVDRVAERLDALPNASSHRLASHEAGASRREECDIARH